MASQRKPYKLEDALAALAREAQAEELALADEGLLEELARLSQRLRLDAAREDGSEALAGNAAEYYGKLADALLELRLSKLADRVSSTGLAPQSCLRGEAAVAGYLEEAAAVAELLRAALLNGSPLALAAVGRKGIGEQVAVLVKQGVQAFQGVDLNRHGPFSPGDIVMLPRADARALISGGQAEEVVVLD